MCQCFGKSAVQEVDVLVSRGFNDFYSLLASTCLLVSSDLPFPQPLLSLWSAIPFNVSPALSYSSLFLASHPFLVSAVFFSAFCSSFPLIFLLSYSLTLLFFCSGPVGLFSFLWFQERGLTCPRDGEASGPPPRRASARATQASSGWCGKRTTICFPQALCSCLSLYRQVNMTAINATATDG